MSSFIQEIRLSTTTSLDVIMKNGQAYRYIGIDPEVLLYLISEYAEIVLEGGSVGRFYNEHIKGAYETEELETTTQDNALDFEVVLSNLREGRSILVGNKEEEQEQSEDDREPSDSDNVTDEGKYQDDKTELSEDDREPSESDNETDEGKDLDDKTMVLQALNLLEKVIGEKGYADTDILIKTIRDYIEK